MRFKSTHGRTQHICAKHPNFGVNEPTGESERESQSDDTNTQAGTGRLGSHRPVDSSPSSHTSQLLDQADEHMVIDPEPIVSDFLQPPMAQAASPFQVSSPPPAFDDLSPFSTSQSPAIRPHDESSDAHDSESTGHFQTTSSSPFSDSSPADTTASADESATCASTDYHPILNGKFTHSISSAFYWWIV